jgi:hypothetical protein
LTYVAHLVSSLGGPVSLEGIRVVVDVPTELPIGKPRRGRGQGWVTDPCQAERIINELRLTYGLAAIGSTGTAADLGIALDGADRAWLSTRPDRDGTRFWRSWL